jgi:hypothetical protein
MLPTPAPGPHVPPRPQTGVGPKPEGGMNDEQQMGPDEIKAQLKMLLSKAKEIAEQNGLDFSQVVSEVEDKTARADVPLPRPPR